MTDLQIHHRLIIYLVKYTHYRKEQTAVTPLMGHLCRIHHHLIFYLVKYILKQGAGHDTVS